MYNALKKYILSKVRALSSPLVIGGNDFQSSKHASSPTNPSVEFLGAAHAKLNLSVYKSNFQVTKTPTSS